MAIPRDRIAYGVDLGTSFSSASFVDSSGAEKCIDPGTGRNNSIPSSVYYDNKKTDIKVGNAAESLSRQCPSNLLFDSKRYLGKFYSDIRQNITHPFKLIEKESHPCYEIDYNNEVQHKTPVEVTSEIVKYIHRISLPQISNDYERLSEDDIDVVISIPAVFSYHQREATIQAAKMGGLRNITLLSEPIAVVLAYISSNHDQIINKSDCNILVYDFGVEKLKFL